MQYRFQIYAMIILIITGLYAPDSYSQKPNYKCTLTNDVLTSNNVYEFDIYLLRTGSEQFELGGIEFGILYNDGIKNGGTLTASYVPGSVDAVIVTSGQQNTLFNTATPGIIKILANLAPGGHGTGAMISSQAPGTKVGRLRITNSVAFSSLRANIALNFSIEPYATLISAYIDAINTDITDSNNYIISLRNPVLSAAGSGIELPKNYDLILNHSNSWSPSAIISYALPFESDVKLIVYNSTGEKVKDLVNAIQKGGYYEVIFDAKTLPGEVYFFTIKANSTSDNHNFTITKKMIFLK